MTHWQDIDKDIGDWITQDGVEQFKKWPCIKRRMVVSPNARWLETEKQYMADVKEGWDATSIHHAYHFARFAESLDIRIDEIASIVEIGGGYGDACNVACDLGFRGTYSIFDLPNVSKIQRFYLQNAKCSVNFITDVAALKHQYYSYPSLALATWSISEIEDAETRCDILMALNRVDYFLFALQGEWNGRDNLKYFEQWAYWRLGEWKLEKIQHIDDNYYLMGRA